MIAVLWLLILLLLAYVIGLALLGMLRIRPEPMLERIVYAIPLGLGVIAYLVLLLGLLGLLTLWWVLSGLLVVGVASIVRSNWVDHRSNMSYTTYREPRHNLTPSSRTLRWPGYLAFFCIAIFGAIIFVNCFVPPGGHEWDALSYHLAAPKVYIQNHRIFYLPTDHHSNFPFAMEMLFTVGLLFRGYALANLLHFATFCLCIAAIFVVARKHLADGAGPIAAAAFIVSPIVIWESGAAYIEMGLALFLLVSIAAVLEYRSTNESKWLALSGALMGFALSVKALALLPFVLVTLLLIVQKVPFRSARIFLMWSIVVGCPFYVKSWIQTRNPVYPFAYSVFRNSRDWNAGLAAGYALEQKGFGQSRDRTSVSDDLSSAHMFYSPPSIMDRARNLLLAPFDLVALPRIFYNFNDPGIHAHVGFLFLALAPLSLIANRQSGVIRWLGLLSVLWFVAWSQTMQYVRYLIPILPLLVLIGGDGASRLIRPFPAFAVLPALAILFQAGLSLGHFGSAFPDQIRRATNKMEAEEYLRRTVDVYESEQWLNTNATRDAGVILFEDTRGFYLDRPYLWGNSPHSLYIPYDSFRSGANMAKWFLDRGYQYALVNLRFTPGHDNIEDIQKMSDSVRAGAEAGLMLEWYRKSTPGERWRGLLGDAIENGAAVVLTEGCARSVVVLEFRRSAGMTAR